MKNIVIIGDSHASLFRNNQHSDRGQWSDISLNNYFDVRWLGPITLWRVCRDKESCLDFENGVNYCPSGLYNVSTRVDKNTDIVLVFGEIDVRCHIFNHGQENFQEIIQNMCDEFEKFLIKYKNDYKLHICSIIPPMYEEKCTSPNPEFPFMGDDKYRSNVTIFFNKKLKDMCIKNNFGFLNIYDIYADSNNMLDYSKSDKIVHAIKTIELENLIKKYFNMTTNEEEDFDFSFFEKTYDFNYCNNWDFETNNIFLKYYFSLYPNRNNLTFFDIGCNGGSFVKSAKLLCENPIIHCFEPHPKLSELVSQHYPDIKMNQLCVSNQNGTCDIFIPLQSVLISSMIDRPIFDILRTKPGADGTIQKVKKYNVQSKTIDTYCKENNIEKIDYLKIDVEGAEMMVLEGAKEMLKTNKIIAGQFEIGSTLDDAGIKKEDIFSYLQNYGYEFNTSLSNDDVFFNIKKN